MASFFSFASPIEIDVHLQDEQDRPSVEVKGASSGDKKGELALLDRERCPVYYDGEAVRGQAIVRVKDGKGIKHDGIKVEFVGSIELFYDRGNHYEFLSLVQELATPGEMRTAQSFDFEFKNVEKQYESYHGINVKLRYFVRVTMSRRMADVVKEKELWVHSFRMPPDTNNSIKMEVGIEDCLHIEFEYNKSKYHLKDVIVGKIYFLLVRIKIKHMELSIIRRETTGAVPNQYNESETITKFEIMDGAPVRGETIPIRLFLGGFELTPTFRDVNKKFSTRYYLNLVLIDEENRRYFKQQEITIYRQDTRVDALENSLPPAPATTQHQQIQQQQQRHQSQPTDQDGPIHVEPEREDDQLTGPGAALNASAPLPSPLQA
ncbi:retromer subunit PEP8 [Sporobolomyces koalae]|uniref:retromer subunit PEP8 n=1 Tax=Sporobolomyces koalae TaxID=500713 RepID=UPI003177B9AE